MIDPSERDSFQSSTSDIFTMEESAANGRSAWASKYRGVSPSLYSLEQLSLPESYNLVILKSN